MKYTPYTNKQMKELVGEKVLFGGCPALVTRSYYDEKKGIIFIYIADYPLSAENLLSEECQVLGLDLKPLGNEAKTKTYIRPVKGWTGKLRGQAKDFNYNEWDYVTLVYVDDSCKYLDSAGNDWEQFRIKPFNKDNLPPKGWRFKIKYCEYLKEKKSAIYRFTKWGHNGEIFDEQNNQHDIHNIEWLDIEEIEYDE